MDWRSLLRRPQMAPIGIDFGVHRLNLLQLGGDIAMPELRAAVSVPYPVERERLFADPAALKSFVRQALTQAAFSGRRVSPALPPGQVRILPLTVHVGAGQNEQQAVARAVRDQLGGPAAESVVDYYHVRNVEANEPERQVLVAVARRDDVLAYLDVLRAVGFDPVSLDIGPAAIARLLAAMQRDDYEQSVMLINFGVAKSFITVVWGRRLMLDREIDFGEFQLATKLAKSLGLSYDIAHSLLCEHGIGTKTRGAHANGLAQRDIGHTIREILHPEFALLADELSRTQVYVASRTRGNSVSRVYLNGSVARYPNIQDRIDELIALPVELLDPLSVFGREPGVLSGTEIDQGFALAAGLALRGYRHG
ncbi:type IV pilus assembly protein PilM [Actimicrobium sp. GrIS 1.19]|uniref:pilus assembly protein PilM n=1 Tax=Actimicrobium sp. GrIS 1.19 TaxID=3071708 RepID=UPI002DFC127F|nr:type IV pilus assembly protein PilM [Actimicrobium sp. GrIS 1.19]